MSFLLDLLGSAANAGAKGIGEYQDQERALERQREAEKLMIERQRTLDDMRADRAESDRLAKMKRMSEQTQDVEVKAQAEGAQRQLTAAQRMAPSVDGNVLEVLKSKLTPDQLEKVYGVKDDPLSRIDDQITVSRREGYYDLEEQLKSAREATRKAIADEFKAANDTRRLDQTIRRGDQQHAEAMARINKQDKDKSDEKLASLTSRKNQALRAISNYDRAGVDKTDPDYQAEVEELRAVNALLKGQGKKSDAPAAAPGKELTYNPKTRKFE